MRAIILFFVCLYSSNKPLKLDYSFCSQSPSEAHLSANTFASMVGNKLKEVYPSKAINLRVTVTKKRDLFCFHWECDIVKTVPQSAQYYFDRRGTFLSGETKNEALQIVEQELNQSKKVQRMIDGFKRAYGVYEMPYRYVVTTYTYDKNRYWCLKEFFCAAPQ